MPEETNFSFESLGGMKQVLAGPFLIIALALDTTGPPVWPLKAVLLSRLISFG
jgi:hypothetical protein